MPPSHCCLPFPSPPKLKLAAYRFSLPWKSFTRTTTTYSSAGTRSTRRRLTLPLPGSDNLLELRSLQDWTVSRHLKTADGVEDVPSEGVFIKMYNVVVQPENLIIDVHGETASALELTVQNVLDTVAAPLLLRFVQIEE